MTKYSRLDYQTALPQLESRIKELENKESEIFIAKIDKTKYKEVYKALKDGKIVFAVTSNSYGTQNIYPYTFAGADKFFFGRMHGSQNSPAYKLATLDSDDAWATYTTNLKVDS